MRFDRQVVSDRITRDPRICGGEPVVAGTRVPVRSVVLQWRLHQDVDWVRSAFPRLQPDDVSAAIAFYQSDPAEIDRLIEENEQAAYSTD